MQTFGTDSGISFLAGLRSAKSVDGACVFNPRRKLVAVLVDDARVKRSQIFQNLLDAAQVGD
jgi:hypothetical protein